MYNCAGIVSYAIIGMSNRPGIGTSPTSENRKQKTIPNFSTFISIERPLQCSLFSLSEVERDGPAVIQCRYSCTPINASSRANRVASPAPCSVCRAWILAPWSCFEGEQENLIFHDSAPGAIPTTIVRERHPSVGKTHAHNVEIKNG